MSHGLYDPKNWDEATRGLDVKLTRDLQACVLELADLLPNEPDQQD